MSKRSARPWLFDDELWSRVEPLLPVPPGGCRRPGRKPVLEDRKV
ncbi:IS5/IS1182 family transposase, partial [Streptomyces sp. NPDC018019]